MEDFATFCKNQPSLLSRFWTFCKNQPFKTKPTALNKTENLIPIDNKLVENNFRGTLFEPFANKDNFWNLIFALGVFLGSITIGLVCALIIMALVLKRFSKVTFLDGKVFNSQGKELSIEKQTPSAVFVILTTVASTVWISMHFSSYLNSLPNTLSAAIIISCFISIPTLFFILKNCPISILFNYDFYKLHAQNAPMPTRRRNEESTSTSSHYWYLPNNIYNPHHRK